LSPHLGAILREIVNVNISAFEFNKIPTGNVAANEEKQFISSNIDHFLFSSPQNLKGKAPKPQDPGFNSLQVTRE
jgi:hypothetical protein